MKLRGRVPGLVAGIAVLSTSAGSTTPPVTTGELRGHVEYLASPALEGRGLGTPGADSAAAYIARGFEAYGLEPLGTGGGWFQTFTARTRDGEVPAKNVVARLAGRGGVERPVLVLGAHYDHLGRAREGTDRGAVRPGADDDASGIAALLELAEFFSHREPLRRSLLFVAFSGEETGLLGSAYFVDHPPVPLEDVLAMVNFDAVGRPDSGAVTLFGAGTAAEFDSLLAVAAGGRLVVRTNSDAVGATDHVSFVQRGIPALHVFGAAHTDLHRPSDTPEKLDYGGFRAIAEFTVRLIEALDRVEAPLTFRQPPPEERPGAPSGRGGARLGIVPDFATSGSGMGVSGVQAGSPAEKAGLRAGDVITGLGGAEVRDIRSLFGALQAHSPGDTVEVVVLRDAQTLTLEAVLGGGPP
jgi:aminopeptidase N